MEEDQVCEAGRNIRENQSGPYLITDRPQEDLADRSDLHRRVIRRNHLPHPHHNNQPEKFGKEHPDKPDGLLRQVLWNQEVPLELFICCEQRNTESGERNICPAVRWGGSIMLHNSI